MHRRSFLALTVAACATPPEQTMVQMAQGGGLPGAGSPPPAGPISGFSASGDAAFDAWREDFVRRQAAAGWSVDFLRQQLSGLTPDPSVVSADRRQPEFSKPISDYLKGAVSPDRITTGRSKRASAAWLPRIEQRYGVPGEILVAIWGMESAFGGFQGSQDVIRSLATLAADGRRRGLAEAHLIAALQIIRDGLAARPQLRGSWAGAMGQTQFMPETFLTTAVDGDGDGRRDIWGSSQDALASAANLLAKQGDWRRGESWAVEVRLPPGFDYSVVEGPKQVPAAWQASGVRRADGYGFNAADSASEAQLIVPMGHQGPAFLAFPNHFAIRKYNNSTSYALGVGMLADAIAGRPGLVGAWPVEEPTSLAQRKAAQGALNRLGYDVGEPDGIIGVKTRAAVRAYQQANGMVADGYMSGDVMRRLIAQAQSAPPLAAPPAVTPN
jgi:membrane-bound lytic murein transglycosylase B